jgi:hypothetical protein
MGEFSELCINTSRVTGTPEGIHIVFDSFEVELRLFMRMPENNSAVVLQVRHYPLLRFVDLRVDPIDYLFDFLLVHLQDRVARFDPFLIPGLLSLTGLEDLLDERLDNLPAVLHAC